VPTRLQRRYNFLKVTAYIKWNFTAHNSQLFFVSFIFKPIFNNNTLKVVTFYCRILYYPLLIPSVIIYVLINTFLEGYVIIANIINVIKSLYYTQHPNVT
jgi:ABC-type sugar transport system permease subunit